MKQLIHENLNNNEQKFNEKVRSMNKNVNNFWMTKTNILMYILILSYLLNQVEIVLAF